MFVDTSAWYALSDQTQSRYLDVQRIMTRLDQERVRLLTSNFVLAETHALILNRLGRFDALAYLRKMQENPASIVRVRPVDERRAVAIIERYADKDFSYTDAASFAVMERLGVGTAFTFDRHFRQFGVGVLEA